MKPYREMRTHSDMWDVIVMVTVMQFLTIPKYAPVFIVLRASYPKFSSLKQHKFM